MTEVIYLLTISYAVYAIDQVVGLKYIIKKKWSDFEKLNK